MASVMVALGVALLIAVSTAYNGVPFNLKDAFVAVRFPQLDAR